MYIQQLHTMSDARNLASDDVQSHSHVIIWGLGLFLLIGGGGGGAQGLWRGGSIKFLTFTSPEEPEVASLRP